MIAKVGYPSPLTFLQRFLAVKFDWQVDPNNSRQLIAMISYQTTAIDT